MRSMAVAVTGLLMCCVALEAQTTEERSAWSIGTSLTYPLARIYQVHINYMPADRHEFIVGPAYQNFRSGSITSHAYTLLLGYRHYVWQGLHAEVELWPAYNRMHSSITGQRYPGVEMWGEVKIGYKASVYRNVFVQPAPGIGFGILRTNRPPDYDDIVSPIFTPQIILGIQL
jgi:hypothetical protein